VLTNASLPSVVISPAYPGFQIVVPRHVLLSPPTDSEIERFFSDQDLSSQADERRRAQLDHWQANATFVESFLPLAGATLYASDAQQALDMLHEVIALGHNVTPPDLELLQSYAGSSA